MNASPPECPVCGSPCGEPPLRTYTVEAAASHFCPPTRSRDRYERLVRCLSRLWPSGECSVYRCATCGFGFGVPFVGGNETFYGILHEQMGYPSWRWGYDMALKYGLQRSSGGRILDVGAGSGNFLDSLGDGWEKHAVEASKTTRAALEAKGIIAHNSMGEIPKKRTFDCITLFQALEHIAEFENTLASCSNLLADGGSIVITVPEAEAMLKQEEITGCADMPPNHINKWSPHSLRLALEHVNIEVQRVIHEPPGLNNLRNKLHLRLIADAQIPTSLAAQVYRVSHKPLRVLLLAALGAGALVRMAPHLSFLFEGGAFCIIGTRSA